MKFFKNKLNLEKIKLITSVATLTIIMGCGEGGGKEASQNHYQTKVDNMEKFPDENSEMDAQKTKAIGPKRISIWSETDQKTYQSMLDSGKKLISIKIPKNPDCELEKVSHYPTSFGKGLHIGSEYIFDISILENITQAVNIPVVIKCNNENWDSINLSIAPR